jgi:hypothetical protein
MAAAVVIGLFLGWVTSEAFGEPSSFDDALDWLLLATLG